MNSDIANDCSAKLKMLGFFYVCVEKSSLNFKSFVLFLRYVCSNVL